jgi:tetratricopeptide (TPR) repeat protein
VEKDDSFAAAWNNLGVVLSTLGDLEEARLSFRAAFALDNGQSDEILQNLRKSITNLENAKADKPPQADFMLVRRGNGRYLLLQTKGAEQI